MIFLVVLLGASAAFWGVGLTVSVFSSAEASVVVLYVVMLAIHITAFALCLKKYRSPAHQEKIKTKRAERINRASERTAEQKKKAGERENNKREKRRQKEALSLERKQKRVEQQAAWREANRKRTTVVSTRLLGEGAAEYKKSVGSMAVRGAVGSVFGPVGAAIGMATAKSKNVNQNTRRFLVKYLDGHIEECEVLVGSSRYKLFMEHLEWEE